VVGRGAPFLLLGLFAGTVETWLARMDRWRRIAEVASGVALLTLAARHGKLAVTPLLSMGIFQARADKSFRFEITFYVVSRGYKNQRKIRFSM